MLGVLLKTLLLPKLPEAAAIGVLKNFAKFTGKHFYQSLFIKLAGLRPASLLKRKLCAQVPSCEF